MIVETPDNYIQGQASRVTIQRNQVDSRFRGNDNHPTPSLILLLANLMKPIKI